MNLYEKDGNVVRTFEFKSGIDKIEQVFDACNQSNNPTKKDIDTAFFKSNLLLI